MSTEISAIVYEDTLPSVTQLTSSEEEVTEIILRYFTNVYGLYHQKLLGFAITKLSNTQLAEDIVSDVFANFYAYLTIKGQDPAILIKNIDAYLMKCVKNKIIDHYRKKSHPNSQLYDDFSSPVDIHQLVEGKMLTERLYSCINRLSVKQKMAILMTLNGCSQRDIAKEIFGASDVAAINSVKALLSRARNTLGEYLSGYCGDGSM